MPISVSAKPFTDSLNSTVTANGEAFVGSGTAVESDAVGAVVSIAISLPAHWEPLAPGSGRARTAFWPEPFCMDPPFRSREAEFA